MTLASVLQRWHGGTIVYQCIHCDHQTRWKSALKRHFLRMHGLKPRKPLAREKLYECILCDHSTKWQSAYRRHMRAKHGILKLRSLSRKRKNVINALFATTKRTISNVLLNIFIRSIEGHLQCAQGALQVLRITRNGNGHGKWEQIA